MGYSLPVTDELARGLLLTNLNQEALVHSIDVSSAPTERLVQMFGADRVVASRAGQGGAVEAYVDRFCQDHDQG